LACLVWRLVAVHQRQEQLHLLELLLLLLYLLRLLELLQQLLRAIRPSTAGLRQLLQHLL
jgi:hypothetical protein